MIKKQTLIALILSIFIASTPFLSTINANSITNYAIYSNGTIVQTDSKNEQTEFLIRYVWIGSLTSAKDVDEYINEHPWGTGIVLTDVSSGILSIISYTGWESNKTWQGAYGGIKYSQLKEVIDEFHKNNWKVIYSAANVPTYRDGYIYNYLTKEHPELIAVSGNTFRYDQIYNGTVMVNFFANYTTPDSARNITVGQRLSDLYCERLSSMISDESFLWDGWFGIDGWNGFTNQDMNWIWSTTEPFGRGIGTSELSNWYYGDDQSINEWESSTYSSGLPPSWNSYSTSQKINWIITNNNLQWWQYWQIRYAQFYSEINIIFDSRPVSFRVGTIIAQDMSSTWADKGVNNPVGMGNLTTFAEYNSFSHYYIDCEWNGDLSLLGRYSAYVAGLVKSKNPDAHCISQMPIAYSGSLVMPTWVWKQMYLSMIETYVWKDGIQYRAVDPGWMLVWAPTKTGWDDTTYNGQEMANWVTTIANTLDDSIVPKWLGPVDVQPLYLNVWSAGASSVNFTFAQFTDSLNLNNTGSNFSPAMGTVFLDATGSYGNAIGNVYHDLLDFYNNGALNVIFSSYRYEANFANTVFMGQGNTECMETFHLTKQLGSSTTATTLPNDEVTDPYARYIIGDTFGKSYSGYQWAGSMGNLEGMIPLVKYDDGPLQIGICYNENSGRFVYGNSWGGQSTIINDRNVLNRAIYWASKCPISPSDSLADIKVFSLAGGEIAISIMNLRNSDKQMALSLDISGLQLDPSRAYRATWIGNGNSVELDDLNQVNVTLLDGADILVISAV